MSYPQRGATYKHEPKFIEDMKRAEGGRLRTPYPTTAELVNARDELRRGLTERQESLAPETSDTRYDLRSEDGLSKAKQKLNQVGLGRAVTLGPSPQKKE